MAVEILIEDMFVKAQSAKMLFGGWDVRVALIHAFDHLKTLEKQSAEKT